MSLAMQRLMFRQMNQGTMRNLALLGAVILLRHLNALFLTALISVIPQYCGSFHLHSPGACIQLAILRRPPALLRLRMADLQ